MKKTLYDYKDIIRSVPLKDKYTKQELLIKDFLIETKYKFLIIFLYFLKCS